MDVKIKPAKPENLKDIQELNHMLFKKEIDDFDPTLDCDWPLSEDGKE